MSADDDLATCPTPYKVVAVIPVHGRVPLLPYTIKRLIQKNDCKVICVGDGLHEKQVCEQSGAVWVPFKNSPLGAKWNAGFVAAKRFNPDAVLYVGSSDWVCNDWIKLLDRKSTRLNSSHSQISYAVFCLKKKKKKI